MPRLCKSIREPIDARRQFVLDSLQPKQKYTCAQVCELTGLTMHHVRAAMQALCDGGAARQKGVIHTPTHYGEHNKTAVYEITGKPYNPELASLKHRQQQSKHSLAEPEGKIKESKIPGVTGGRLIRFGRDYKTAPAQTMDGRRTAGSALNWID